jgi:hypothetical protein
MFIDPFESLGMLMSGMVVDDDMNGQRACGEPS